MPLDDILREISVDDTWERLEHITGEIPSRLAGSTNARRMAEYADQEFRKGGLDSRIDEFPGLVSFPEPATIQVLAPESFVIEGHTLAQSLSTDGLEGELVDVGRGAEADYEGRDVHGMITLSEYPYAPARHEKALVAWRHGATAQIFANWGDEECEAVAFGSIKSPWGNPTPEALEREMPQIVGISISRVDGIRLKRLCERGPVRVRISARAENGWHQLSMTSAEFGAQGDREFLLVGGHMYSWFGPQATDNGSGDACILELARVFKRHEGELRRGLVAALWMGHETGTMISSSRFADVNWDRLRHSCVAYLQIDQPGIAQSSVWHVSSTDDIQRYAVRAAEEMVGDIPVKWGRQSKNGDSSFFGVGLASLAGETVFSDEEIQRTALANLGWFHHSIHNTLDKLDKDLLATHLRVYANWMWGLLTDPILPHEYAPLGRRFVERLAEFAAYDVPAIDLAGAVAQAQTFQALAEQLDAAATTWRQRLQDGSADGDAAAARLNQAKLKLSRVLVPIASTAVGPYGQDRYGHAWQTQMIPSLVPYPQLAGSDRQSEAFQTWWVAMVRARNRVVDALALASDIVRPVLEEVQ
jgi:hypothetical protein